MKYAEFCRTYFPHYFKLPPSKMHAEFIGEMDSFHLKRGQRVCYVAPAEGAKTTHWSKIYEIYCICYNLESFILLGSNVAGQSERNLDAIKTELEDNVILARDFPHVCGVGRKWNQSEIITRNGVKVITAGRGTAIRGATFGASRVTLMVFDDLDDEESIGTKEARDKAWDWLTRTAIPRGQTGYCNVVVIDTLKHVDDITQRCSRTPGWYSPPPFRSVIKWSPRKDLWAEWGALYRQQTIDKNEKLIPQDADPAKDFFEANRDDMLRDTDVLWPEKESYYDLMVFIQQNGEKAFATEKQGEAKSPEDAEWPLECFDESVVLFREWPVGPRFVMACDPSKGKTARSDPSAWVWGCRGKDGFIYVDADINRRDASDICLDGINIAAGCGPVAIGVEEDSYGALIELWKMKAKEVGMFDALPSLLTINSQENKLLRIRRGLTQLIRGYKIKFRANSVGVGILLDQLRAFPRPKEHDDGPDALEMFMRLLLWWEGGGLQQMADEAANQSTATPYGGNMENW